MDKNAHVELSSPWMDARQAALYIGRRSKTAYKSISRLARSGRIRAGHDGKRFLFSQADLDNWLYMRGKKAAVR